MGNQEPIYETNYLGTKIRVYSNRVEYTILFETKTIPINQVAGIELGIPLYYQIVIETAGGKKHKIPCKDKAEVRDAIFKAQEAFSSSKGTTSSLADELAKLAELKNKGILTHKEFEDQKQKLLT